MIGGSSTSRRSVLKLMLGTTAAFAGPGLALPALAAEPPRGGTVNFILEAEPPTLVTIAHTAGGSQRISPKITEGLLTYDFDLKPRPVLATAWDVAPDGLTYTFKLRQGVKWHDGRDFTSADVAYSFGLLKQSHPRGRGTFANVTEVTTPDAFTIVLKLSKPTPFLLSALDATESPIVPKHVYEGTDPLTNKNGSAPIGTGPFMFKEWVKGSHVLLERNPNYWDAGKPHLDRVVVRFIADEAARAAGFETGELDIGAGPPVARADLDRLKELPQLAFEDRGGEYNASLTQLFFNYENPIFKDIRVRQAIAHAIDTTLLLETVWYGYGKVSPTVVSPYLTKFHDPSVPPYAFDAAKAEKLLDEAGFPRKSGGTRFPLRLYNNPYYGRGAGEFIRQALTAIGIAVDLQNFDFSTYIVKTYTERKFDLTVEALSNIFDPNIGVQRAYWSKNFKIGLPFSNASHYENPEIDRLLEASATEADEEQRVQLWRDIQRKLYDDVASVTLIAPQPVTIFNKRVKNHTLGAAGVNASFADVYVES
ncbi:ABC transporter substrate-binding protein [Methylopila sp. Yamaguchi]|uniref:ABC transporter substrate-binding protein n=1 Tax=Methylopila sp. Yamaguchi TaxID=1437817 RepID=UPI000CC51CF3|nr:ABC transporter substrate-binding protein [Methylopila sp. Yamaguchi]GBD46819.1 ABC transporter substrate-binding protein [Methylopila sp. Yamaguchi]